MDDNVTVGPELFQKAGGGLEAASTPDVINVEWLAGVAEQRERALRADPSGLTAEEEAEIARHKPVTNLIRALRLYSYLSHLDLIRRTGLRSSVPLAERRELVRQIVEREPIRIRIAGTWFPITSRSRAADIALARHDLQRRVVVAELNGISELFSDTEQQLAAAPRSAVLRRRLRRLQHTYRELYAEVLYHTRCILANALTGDGSSADAGQAPEWWAAITPEDEGQVLKALFDVGPGRYQALGPPPDDGYTSEHRALHEEVGFWSLYAAWEGDIGLKPAELHNTDRAQLLTWRRLGAPYVPPSTQTVPDEEPN